MLVLAVCLLAAACQKESGPTFDGEDVKDAAAVRAHGERLSHVLGCVGCHGEGLQGTLLTKYDPATGPLYASNLTLAVPRYSDAQLDGIIRRGLHPTRKDLWTMPSQAFQSLDDGDFKALLAYLRTLKPAGKDLPLPQFTIKDRQAIASGKFKPAAQLVQEYANAEPIDLGPKYALGRYIASVTCTACHGSALQGDPANKAPDLVIAGSYSRSQFERLLTTGIPVGGRKLDPMMYYAARGRFTHLTPHERDVLYEYLKTRANKVG
ncbi:MAG TPA: c-type cytochrome [Sphingomicrobium sp.]|nr:c-type cytochrome [Sphingomicrobium sp.]